MRVMAVLNQKGGVGKTTAAVNLGAGLGLLGRKVLLIDADPQAHLTCSLLGPTATKQPDLLALLRKKARLEQAVILKGQLGIIASGLELSGADTEFAAAPGRETLLRELLHGLSGWDFVIIDCPPNLGLLTLMSLVAANEIFIPMLPEFLALQSLGVLLGTVEVVQRRFNPELEIAAVALNRFSPRKRLGREVLQRLREHFGESVYFPKVRESVALAEAPGFAQDIFSYAPKSQAALDYMAICRNLLARKEA